jgi:hypothetical protein
MECRARQKSVAAANRVTPKGSEVTMTLQLPKPVAEYFSADQRDASAVADCFTENAVVIDEKQTYSGRQAITRWKQSASTRYNYTSKPFASEKQGKKIVISSRLTGDFPGSPVDLRYVFELDGDKIALLEIKS